MMAGFVAIGPGAQCHEENVLVMAVGDDVYFKADFSGDEVKLTVRWCRDGPVPTELTPEIVYEALEQFGRQARMYEVIEEVQEGDVFNDPDVEISPAAPRF
jgi:hypothetical protein